jgi:hypothetical protein
MMRALPCVTSQPATNGYEQTSERGTKHNGVSMPSSRAHNAAKLSACKIGASIQTPDRGRTKRSVASQRTIKLYHLEQNNKGTPKKTTDWFEGRIGPWYQR